MKNEIENDDPKQFTQLQNIACKNSVTCSSCENFYVVIFFFLFSLRLGSSNFKSEKKCASFETESLFILVCLI